MDRDLSPLTFFPHADFAAFLESAGLALPPQPHVHLGNASAAVFAPVRLVSAPCNRTAEETLGGFSIFFRFI